MSITEQRDVDPAFRTQQAVRLDAEVVDTSGKKRSHARLLAPFSFRIWSLGRVTHTPAYV